MDAVQFELTRMTWQGWIVDLVGGCGLGWLVYLFCTSRGRCSMILRSFCFQHTELRERHDRSFRV